LIGIGTNFFDSPYFFGANVAPTARMPGLFDETLSHFLMLQRMDV